MRGAKRRASYVGAFLALTLAAACGGSPSAPPEPDRIPVITVTGVEDGDVFHGPVTIRISVDVGTFEATLDGEAFTSGTTVSEPGAHVLTVFARNRTATNSLTLQFVIVPSTEPAVLIVRMFDLGDNDAGGGGDAILVTDTSAAGQRHMLVDAGPEGVGGANTTFVAARLDSLGVDTLEAVILTHAHTDHYLGLPAVLDGVFVRRFLYNGQKRNLTSYNDLIALAESRAAEVTVPTQTVSLSLGAAVMATDVRVLPPLTDHLDDPGADGSQINEGSLGAGVTRGTFSMFLTGDGEVKANLRWRTDYADLTRNLDVLKVGHHGANDATFDNGSSGASSWLEHTDPRIQIISANGRTHPRIRALAALMGRAGTQTYCTNVHGDIELRVDVTGTVTVAVEKNAGADCVPGTDATS